MLNNMRLGGSYNKSDWSDGILDLGNDGTTNDDGSDWRNPGQPGEPWNDPNANLGGFDPGGDGVYNGDLNGIYNSAPNTNGDNPFGNFTNPFAGSNANGNTSPSDFNLSSLFSGNTGTLISAFLDQQNNQQAQDDIDEMIRAGIPYDQSNRNAASERLTGLTNGTINASSDPAFMANLGLKDENLMRQFNAKGMHLSGNEVGALSQQDLAAFSKYRQDELEREMTRSGATFNPSSTANAGITAAAFMAAMRGNSLSSLLAALGRKPDTTTINNNPNGNNNNNPNGNRNNTNNPNNNTSNNPNDPNYWRNSPGNNTWTGDPNIYDENGNYQSWNDPNYVPPDPTNPDWFDPNNTMPDDIPIDYGYPGDVDYGDPFGGGGDYNGVDYGDPFGGSGDYSDWSGDYGDWGDIDWGALGEW